VAEASFNISIEAMSFGLMEFNGLRGVRIPVKLAPEPLTALELSSGKPSTTYSGLLPALIEPTPRILTEMPPPGSPLF
jgi:hypothetical protein